jgi:hypothetical protein
MTGGSLNANGGDLFYVTNTDCAISLTNVSLSSRSGVLLRVSGNDGTCERGDAGANGGICVFACSGQVLSGEIIVDSISSLELTLSDESDFTGTINPGGTAGDVSLTLANDSVWTLTGDAYLTSFDGKVKNIVTNDYTVYVNGSAITK